MSTDRTTPKAETEHPEEWGFEGGDGHGYRYQYIGPIHYLCECEAYFLNRDGWIAHKALVPIAELSQEIDQWVADRRTAAADIGPDDRNEWIHFTAGLSEAADRLRVALLDERCRR